MLILYQSLYRISNCCHLWWHICTKDSKLSTCTVSRPKQSLWLCWS